jgi:hypothetical protein
LDPLEVAFYLHLGGELSYGRSFALATVSAPILFIFIVLALSTFVHFSLLVRIAALSVVRIRVALSII